MPDIADPSGPDHPDVVAPPEHARPRKRMSIFKIIVITCGVLLFIVLAAGIYIVSEPNLRIKVSAHLGIERSRAANAMKIGDYQAVARHLEAVVNANPNDGEALIDLGDAYEMLQRPDDAMAVFKRAAAISPALHNKVSLRIAAYLIAKSTEAIYAKDIDTAEKLVTEASQWQPNWWMLMQAQGNVHLWRHHNEEALAAFAKARELASEANYPPAARLYDQANAEYISGRYQEALDHAKEGLALDPAYSAQFAKPIAYCLSRNAQKALSAKDFPEALKLAEQSISYDKNCGLALWVLAYVRMHEDKLTEALELFERAEIGFEPGHYKPESRHYDFGTVYMRLRQWDKAEPHFAELVKLNPERSEIWMYYGECLRYVGKYAEAIAAYEKAALSPDLAAEAKKRIDYSRSRLKFDK